MQCLTLTLENPPARGEYRVFNQFEEAYDISALAHQVRRVAGELGLATRIRHLENPRWELEEHFYAPDHQHLLDLGYRPTRDMAAELRVMLADLLSHRERIAGVRHVLIPEIRWRGAARKVVALDRIKEPGRGTVAGDPAASDADGARTFSP
jgi:UDP-sulfoquinovose synthase